MKRFIYTVGYLIVALSLFFLVRNISINLGNIPRFSLSYRSVLVLTTAILLCSSIVAILGLAWRILIRGGNISLSVKQAYVIIGQSQIGKYLPGNIWHYAGRIALSRQYGISTEATVLSTGVETITLLATGFIIALVGLLLSNRVYPQLILDFNTISLNLLIISAISGIIIFGLLTIGTERIARGAADNLWLSTQYWFKERLPYVHVGRIAIAGLLYIVIFLIFGTTTSLLLSGLWEIDVGVQWYQFVWGFSVAWVIGFVTPGAPGGVGVRETILIVLYSPELGEGLALGLSLMLRVVTSLGDLVAFGLAYYLSRT